MKQKKGLLALVLALTLVVGAGVGGTVAWLAASSNSVTNTFSYGDINIKLEEHENGKDSAVTSTGMSGDVLKLVPGVDLPKDPYVVVQANSEKCYLFVQVTEENWPASGVTYGEGDGWTKGSGTIPETVYYRTVDSSSSDQTFYVLAGTSAYTNGAIVVADELAKGDITATPTLKFDAWAMQYDGFMDAETAWQSHGSAIASKDW